MCGGFTCSKNSLLALNVVYVLVAFVLIFVAAYAKGTSIVSSLSLVSGIIACGVFLLIISIVGLIGATKHHQVILFFYMIILFIIFIIQFSLACACLAMNETQQKYLTLTGWNGFNNDTRHDVQVLLHCCGFSSWNDTIGHPPCDDITNEEGVSCCDPEAKNCCNSAPDADCKCKPCEPIILKRMNYGLSVSGGIGLFFSFTEFIGVWLTVRYRNQRDPRANPSAFL
ncbi:tetraspanin 97E isoform X2 [Oratosquilla oratoria]|uniref:tetraspanin 97E isoform X2 n=1 Tax=Oratosquilla oratoria TaxID=337810 RepID=UPI003F759416